MSLLKQAILIWKAGNPIDTSHWSTLAAQGFDVASLERRYCV